MTATGRTIDEILTGVSVALSLIPVDVCPVLDTNADRVVHVDEVLAAVANVLNTCG